MSPAASSRWCPTPEQLMILEEMYRGGIRTPNASQIQQITAHLSFYGKIEGKNVFYWFQNHKARDRQKLRRKLMSKQLHQHQHQHQHQLFQQHHNNHHEQNHHHPLHYLDSPPPPPPPPPLCLPHQLPHYSSLEFLPQGGAEHKSTQMMNYTWKGDQYFPAERCEMDITNPNPNPMVMRTYGCDLLMMLQDGAPTPPSPSPPPPPPPYCNSNKPLKTLQLFPIKATAAVKENSTSTN